MNGLALATKSPIQDVHFRIEGPAVARLQEVFADDWEFTPANWLRGEAWFPELDGGGPVLARGITSGPDANYEKLRSIFLGGCACARESVRIVTPYFLPDSALIAALKTAALRGVQIDVVLPAVGNLRTVQWASTTCCRNCWGTAAGFGPRPRRSTTASSCSSMRCGPSSARPTGIRAAWGWISSSTWNATTGTGRTLEAMVAGKQTRARPITLEERMRPHPPVKLRDGLARLLTPYL